MTNFFRNVRQNLTIGDMVIILICAAVVTFAGTQVKHWWNDATCDMSDPFVRSHQFEACADE